MSDFAERFSFFPRHSRNLRIPKPNLLQFSFQTDYHSYKHWSIITKYQVLFSFYNISAVSIENCSGRYAPYKLCSNFSRRRTTISQSVWKWVCTFVRNISYPRSNALTIKANCSEPETHLASKKSNFAQLANYFETSTNTMSKSLRCQSCLTSSISYLQICTKKGVFNGRGNCHLMLLLGLLYIYRFEFP